MSASSLVRPSPPRQADAMQRVAVGLVWVSLAASLAGFVLPWVELDLRGLALAELAGAAPAGPGGAQRGVGRVTVQVRRDGRMLAAALPTAAEFPQRVRGIQIPGFIRQEQTQAAVALLELLTDTRQHAILKSYAVFLVPGVALFCGALLTGWGHRPAVAGGVSLTCAAVAVGGVWRLLTLETSQSIISVTIGWGLWLSLASYVGLASSAALTHLGRRIRR